MRRHTIPLLVAGMAAVSIASASIDQNALTVSAQARACYLGILALYDAQYLRDADSTAPTRCVQLDYRRAFSADELAEATREIFAERHGGDVAQRFAAELTQVGHAYRTVEPGDRYTFCVGPRGNGVLLHNGDVSAQFPSAGFSERFMQIWVLSEDAQRRPRWAFTQC